jgi:hypothetical protein
VTTTRIRRRERGLGARGWNPGGWGLGAWGWGLEA